jgi:xanthine dehydrogenase accessory factor
MNVPPFATDIHQAVVDFADAGRPFALAVVLAAEGSTPRQAGTKALIDSGGAIRGTIGGGPVEAETQRRAVEAIRAKRPLVFDFVMEGASAQSDRPICGGRMRILIDPTAADQRAVYAQAADACRRRERGVLLTTVRMAEPRFSAEGGMPAPPLRGHVSGKGENMPSERRAGHAAHDEGASPGNLVAPVPQVTAEWFPQGAVPADVGFPGGEAIRAATAGEAPKHFVQDLSPEGPRLEVLVEPLIPAPVLVIAGGGHIGQALALQAGLVGFDVVVIDDRSEFTDAALFPPGAVTRCGDIARELAALPAAGDTYIVVVTRGHRHDKEALAACIRKPAAYLGMIGSRRKVALIRKELAECGAAAEEELRRVYAPIGLDIGAETVPEIAASIVAQLIAVRRKGSAARMPSA